MYIYIYIHVYIYIHIYHIHECVNAHVSQANALLKLNTRPLKKKKICSKDPVLSETGWKWLCFGWSPNFIQFLPVLSTTQIPSFVDDSSPLFCGPCLYGWNPPKIPGFSPGFSIGGPSISASFEATDAFVGGAVEGWRWQPICNQYVMVVNITPVSLGFTYIELVRGYRPTKK